ncbi:hypothetical protein SY83_03165 [Paenibacillus swuensis]|uniref:Fe/B12 periplasmic-binding domain-containing protein n=1 Tax=Paenibacillus swuensis TaxID=1178515 RepID=A0A172TFC6_9BACL|nr:ABC transporter substrate-binding protein [Paenibacillus swuensis]ANE45483.1 hypothetical protein SY83_03165 [Paenibacillus swuensis]
MKRTLLVLTLIAILFVVGCANGNNTNTATNTNANAGNTANDSKPVDETDTNSSNSAAVYPKKITHALGETTIPAMPKRVVDVGYATDYLKALNAPLVGATAIDWVGSGKVTTAPYLELGSEVTPLPMTDYRPNLEQVLSLKPDLIIASIDQKDQYEKLTQIAPTIIIDGSKEDWRTIFQNLAVVFGKEEKAAEILNGLKDKVEQGKAAVTIPDAVWVHTDLSAKELAIGGPLSYADVLYYELGIKPSPIVPEGWAGMVSTEAFVTENPENILLFSSKDPAKVLADWKKDPLLGKVAAIKNDKAVLLTGTHWMNAGPISMDRRLDDVIAAYK